MLINKRQLNRNVQDIGFQLALKTVARVSTDLRDSLNVSGVVVAVVRSSYDVASSD